MDQTAPLAWHIGDTQTPLTPKVAGLLLLGNAMNMRKAPARFNVECYQMHGQVFRLQFLQRELPDLKVIH